MARTKTAKSKSSDKNKPEWLSTSEKDIEAIITKLAKQNLSSEKIGLVLRDNYGIPKTRLLGTSISKILKKQKLYKDADVENLTKKHNLIKKHLEKNKQDKSAKRTLTIISARIKKLTEYRRKKDKI